MLEVYLETNTNNIACLGGEGCGMWDGRGAGNVCGLQIDCSLCGTPISPTTIASGPSHSRHPPWDF